MGKPIRRKFYGATDKHTIQTLDIGSGHPHRVSSRAKKNPNRKYAAADHLLGYSEEANIYRYKNTGLQAIEILKRRKEKTRHINFDMPFPDPRMYQFEEILREAKKVLIPNGKIYITSENKKFLDIVRSMAEKEGYSFGMENLHEKAYMKGIPNKFRGLLEHYEDIKNIRTQQLEAIKMAEKNPKFQRLADTLTKQFKHKEKLIREFRIENGPLTETMLGYLFAVHKPKLYRMTLTYNLKTAYPRLRDRKDLEKQ